MEAILVLPLFSDGRRWSSRLHRGERAELRLRTGHVIFSGEFWVSRWWLDEALTKPFGSRLKRSVFCGNELSGEGLRTPTRRAASR